MGQRCQHQKQNIQYFPLYLWNMRLRYLKIWINKSKTICKNSVFWVKPQGPLEKGQREGIKTEMKEKEDKGVKHEESRREVFEPGHLLVIHQDVITPRSKTRVPRIWTRDLQVQVTEETLSHKLYLFHYQILHDPNVWLCRESKNQAWCWNFTRLCLCDLRVKGRFLVLEIDFLPSLWYNGTKLCSKCGAHSYQPKLH